MDSHEKDFTTGEVLEIAPDTSLNIVIASIHKLNSKISEIIKDQIRIHWIRVVGK
jgi:translation initiation factor IF-1